MTYNITLTANHQSLTAEYLPLAAESVQYLTAKVVCETEDWAGREIKAMFGQGCTVHEVSVTGGEITAKQQLNLTAGDWRVWLVGNSARDGEVIPRITTNVAHISVAPTGGTEGNPFPTTPPTVEEQLRADMGNLADLTTEDKSSLVAAINEAAASGGSKDAVTYTPQTLTEGQQKQARTNIGAEKAGTGYTKPASGIPKSDLAEDVQTSLAKADTAISLGLTAATPGQIIKVKAVQDGKPTEWEAVDMQGEYKWEKIAAVTLTDAAAAITQNFGREYAEIIIVDTVPVVAEGAALGIKADDEDVFYGAGYIADTGAYARQRVYHMYPLDGYLVTDADQANANINKKNSLTLLRQSAIYSKDTIGSLYYYARSTDVLLPSGTKLEIYGVRA